MAQRLPRFYRHQQQIEDLKRIATIILEGGEVENEAGLPFADRPTATARTADGGCR